MMTNSTTNSAAPGLEFLQVIDFIFNHRPRQKARLIRSADGSPNIAG